MILLLKKSTKQKLLQKCYKKLYTFYKNGKKLRSHSYQETQLLK